MKYGNVTEPTAKLQQLLERAERECSEKVSHHKVCTHNVVMGQPVWDHSVYHSAHWSIYFRLFSYYTHALTERA